MTLHDRPPRGKFRKPEQLELPLRQPHEEPDRGIAAMIATLIGGIAVVCSIVWIVWSMLRAGM